MKTIIKYIRYVIFLNCISLLNLSADSCMLEFNKLDSEQQNIHAFLCRQAVFGNYKDTTNRFSVAISFVFENGARKTFLIKAPGDKAYFESGSLKVAHDDKYKEKLNSIIKDEKIGNYINRKLRNNEYPEQEKYRLGDSEVSFLYAINKVAKFQIDCVQSLAKKITYKLARIELHGFTTRDMCPCCLSYMEYFVEQSNKINLKSEKTNNADPKDKGKGINGSSNKDVLDNESISKQFDNGNKNENANLSNDNGFQNFFKCLFDEKNVKKHIPKGKGIPINFFISSLVELSGKAYNCSVYQGYKNAKEKLPDAKEIDKNGNNLYCILLRKEGSENLSQKEIIIENNDCFALNMKDNQPRYLGKWKDWNEGATEFKNIVQDRKNKDHTPEYLCGYYYSKTMFWSRIDSDGTVKEFWKPKKDVLESAKNKYFSSVWLNDNDGFFFDATTGKFSFDRNNKFGVDKYNKKGDFSETQRYYYNYRSDAVGQWWHISKNGFLEPISNMPSNARDFKQAKVMYNANHIFDKKDELNEVFGNHLNNHAEQINNDNEEGGISKIVSGCSKPIWYRDVEKFYDEDNKDLQTLLRKQFFKECESMELSQDETEMFPKIFSLNLSDKKNVLKADESSFWLSKYHSNSNSEGIVKDNTESKETKIPDVNVFKILNDFVKNKLKKNFLVLIEQYGSWKTFKRCDRIEVSDTVVELEELGTDNTLFLYHDSKKYYKITPKTMSVDAEKQK